MRPEGSIRVPADAKAGDLMVLRVADRCWYYVITANDPGTVVDVNRFSEAVLPARPVGGCYGARPQAPPEGR